MPLNINDRANLPDLRRVLTERNVSATAITTLERALERGMTFERLEDLAILDIPALDVGTLGEAVEFGAASAASNVKTVEYQFKPVGDETAFFGYQLIVRFVDRHGFTIEEAYPVEDDRTVLVDYDLAVLRPESRVVLRVNTATGSRAKLKLQGSSNAAGEFVELPTTDLANAEIEVIVEPRASVQNPTVAATYPVRGKLISNKTDGKLDGYQIVLFAATAPASAPPAFAPVAVARTETNGYFVTTPLLFENPADINRVAVAKAAVSKDEFSTELPVRLVSVPETSTTPPASRIPDRVILVIDERAATTNGAKEECNCGCNDLNFHEKKVLEEYSYYTVVRTSEPSIIADVLEDEPEIDLREIYGVPGKVPFSVFKKFHEIQSRQLKPTNFTPAVGDGSLARTAGSEIGAPAGGTSTATNAAAASRTPWFNHDLLRKLLIDYKVDTVVKGTAKPVFRGRAHLNQTNQIDWDDEPTIYQAASIAHGHLLHFKQEWIPDGYSLGDLVYSLPLAPGQKKQIAVLDWERRESAANSQSLDYEETLNNSLVRDRDINEVVSGTLTENIRANSRAVTGGIGFGLGGAAMGLLPGGGTFGALLGISGGGSVAKSTASQSAARDMTSSSLQSIRDRTQQAASAVRSQRATVVQTVSQGERVQATAESVANYNHCHAITIQYFEVLRHFQVRNRLAGVQECLFVPLQMTRFDMDKCLRWRNSLERHLLRPELRGGFDAIARIKHEKESPFENYYDSIGYPRKNFAEQAVNFYGGELLLEFFFFNTNERKIDDEIVAFYSFFGISLDAYRDKQITDDDLAKHVGPRAIEYLLDAFRVETDKGVDLRLDLTLVSAFRQNAPLRVSLRQSANTPRYVPRDQIDAITLRLDLSKLPPDQASNLAQFQNKYMKIRLRWGQLRYRTENFAGMLFDGRIDNDVFAGSDGAYLPAPLTREELRNPRGEDVDAANNLIHHLNENLEYYDTALFSGFTSQRRFMLLDGIIAPGKANGRSVASVVENRVIGIAGNSLVLPVAPGYQLDPTIDETFDLFAQYYHDEPDPIRISMPTKGVYAEAVMGQCNSCEEKDESRFWRWEESPIPDSPTTQILPINTDTRRADPGNLQAKDFPSPVVNIQNAPSVPDPAGLQNLLQLLGRGDAFRDLTGLSQNQLNALSAYQKALDTAQSFGQEAAELAKTAATVQMAKDAQKSGSLSNEDTKAIVKKTLDPHPEKEREETAKDVDAIDQAKKNDQVDEIQAREMTEDRIRRGQKTSKSTPTPPKKGTRKFHLSLYIRDFNHQGLEGTWVLNFGSLREETFETDASGLAEFDIELDPSRRVPFYLRGNPIVTNVSFGPEGAYYYHRVTQPILVGSSADVTIMVDQQFVTQTVTTENSATDSEIKLKATVQEGGSTGEVNYESGFLAQVFGKVSMKATITAKETETNSTTESESSSSGNRTVSTVEVLSRRLKVTYNEKVLVQ